MGLPRPDLAKEENQLNDYVFERRIEFKHADGSSSTGRIDLYKRNCVILEAKQSAKRQTNKPSKEQLTLLPEDAGQQKLGQAKRGPRTWDKVMKEARKQAENYARALPVEHGYPPFLLILDVGHVLEVFADFSGQGKNYAQFPDRQSFRISMDDLLEQMKDTPKNLVPALESLWAVMGTGGYAPQLNDTLKKFNGVLFKKRKALPLDADDIHELWVAARRDWRDVEPAIFGTLLERALDARERSKLGAHYTPRAYVERLVIPTIIEPLRDDWEAVQARAQDLIDQGEDREAVRAVRKFHRQLCSTRVLDPACGTGNFLYVALELMKKLEGEVLETITELGSQPDRYQDYPDEAGRDLVGQKLARSGGRFSVDPHQFYGLEINPRAVPIADLVLWIGYLKWQLKTGGPGSVTEPVLDAYGTIKEQDAILSHDQQDLLRDDQGKPLSRWDGVTMKHHPITGEDIPDPDASSRSLIIWLKPVSFALSCRTIKPSISSRGEISPIQ